MRKYYLLAIVGLASIIVGLLIIIFWQKRFVQLQPLQCPENEVPIAFSIDTKTKIS